MSIAVPSWLLGVWQREWIRHGEHRDESMRVRYLQTPTVFADVRVSRHRPAFAQASCLEDLADEELLQLAEQRGFAGTTTVDGEVATWHRELDFQPPSSELDIGRLEKIGVSALHEHALDSSFVEYWWSLSRGDQRFLVLRVDRRVADRRVADRDGSIEALRLDRLLVLAGDHFVYARNRGFDLDPAPSLRALLERVGSRAFALEALRCEVSYGAVRGGDMPWQITVSTLPWRERTALSFAEQMSVDPGSAQLAPRRAPPADEVYSTVVNTMQERDLQMLFPG